MIDGDVFAYEAATATEQVAEFDGQKVGVPDYERAVKYFDEIINKIQTGTYKSRTERAGADADVVVALSCKTRHYFRHDLWPTYKATRVNTPRPEALDVVKQHIEKRYTTYRMPGLEADDVLGILATSDRTVKGHKIIVSTDKDMKQIPGDLYNPNTKKIEKVTPTAGHYWHMYQTLVGDRCDNYPGCPKIGPVKASRILDVKPNTVNRPFWERVVATFTTQGLTEEDALTQARVSRILQAPDWDRKTQKVKLWTPC